MSDAPPRPPPPSMPGASPLDVASSRDSEAAEEERRRSCWAWEAELKGFLQAADACGQASLYKLNDFAT